MTLAGYDASANTFIYQIAWSTPVCLGSAVGKQIEIWFEYVYR
jgi:hypothetical protein